MKQRWSYVTVSGLILGVVAGWTVPVSAVPRVVCTRATFDFGILEDSDTVVQHAFVLENQGDEMLTFGKVRACCGTTASLRADSVAPGTNTLFDVKLSLKGRYGPVNKSVYVATNDPRQPHLVFHLTGRVERSTGSSPPLGGGVLHEAQPGNITSDVSDIVVVPQTLTVPQSDPPKPVTR